MNLSPSRALLTVLALAFAPLSASNTTPTAPTVEPTPPATAAYTNQPPPPVIVERNDYYNSNYNSGSFHNGTGFYNHNVNSSYTTYYQQPLATFYFPPTPPPLGGEFLLFRRYNLGEPETQLPQLMPYVGEPFYAPLSAHLHREDLSKKQRARLDAYQAARAVLLTELQAKLAATRDADPATRARTLTEFAAQQTPRLAALELEAEAIRENLVEGSFTQSRANWNDNRSWALGDDLRYESRVDEFKVIRASAFFTAGLSPAQRRLLRELAMELDEPLGEPTASIALDAPKPLLLFSPATARIDLPADLAPDVAAKIAAYTAAKAALKSELRAVIYKQDRAFFGFTRTNALRALATAQADRLAAIETQAEEIRVALAPYARASRPPMSFLPEELNRRIATYLREKQDLQRTLVDKLAAMKSEFPEHRVEFIRLGEGYNVEIITSRRANRRELARVDAMKSQLAAFNTEQTGRFTKLGREKVLIQNDLTAAVKAKLRPTATGVDMDLLLRNFAAQFAQQEMWQRYRDYDTAVYEPGLSPEQRRLLYSDALVQLDLPLPRGSKNP